MTATLSPDAARIIAQLDASHAASNAAGLGSPALDAFQDLIVEMVAVAADPKARICEIADLLTRERAAHPAGGAR